MRYLIHKSQQDEIPARQTYLYDIFHLYFLPGNLEGNFIPLNPVGALDLDVLFLTGHTNNVQQYLETRISNIPETCIVITSCMGKSFRRFVASKELYVSNLDQATCYLRDGKPYGFDFHISDAELDFFNSSGSIMDRIYSTYTKL